MEKLLSLPEIKSKFPDQWVLLGNPVFDDSKLTVLAGIPIYHSPDQKEVCYLGKDKRLITRKLPWFIRAS
mgnify:CR=1 FL=1